jgi:hypothetical protein
MAVTVLAEPANFLATGYVPAANRSGTTGRVAATPVTSPSPPTRPAA